MFVVLRVTALCCGCSCGTWGPRLTQWSWRSVMTSSVTWLSIRSREFFWLLGTVVCLSISGCVFHCLCLPVVVSSLSFSDSEFLSLWVYFFVSLWVCLSVCHSSLSLFLIPPPPPPFFISCLARAKLFRQVLTESKVSVGGRGGGGS